MKFRLCCTTLLIALFGILSIVPTQTRAAAQITARPLRGIAVNGYLEDGSSFRGKLTINSFAYLETEGLVINGSLKGTGLRVEQTLTHLPVTLRAFVDGPSASCNQVYLTLGTISLSNNHSLNLAALTIDVARATGNEARLGNALCSLTGLLSPMTGTVSSPENLSSAQALIREANAALQ